ncbi:unnamed protein product [Caenorhabditis auriculariae]|uniref:Uncharacterized protein n=1 Tax=Caenorhabditis auriculariae TaxID=2777116 RepID=A0A8S1HRU9_9PELO|nr:unnamed protein product [Caenorhabditis auriculariae]
MTMPPSTSSAADGRPISEVDARDRPVSLLRRNESTSKEKKQEDVDPKTSYDNVAALDAIDKNVRDPMNLSDSRVTQLLEEKTQEGSNLENLPKRRAFAEKGRGVGSDAMATPRSSSAISVGSKTRRRTGEKGGG